VKLRILLINPWVYDFAACNVWSMPLGLLRVAELLSRFDLELSLIDCTGASIPRKFSTGKYPKEIVEKPQCLRSVPRRFGRYGMPLKEFRRALATHAPFDFVFITSIMSYWYPGVREVVGIIREDYGAVPVVLGGIYATLWDAHASSTSGADFIYKGRISEDIKFVFHTFGFRIKKMVTGDRCDGRQRGEIPYYKLGLFGRPSFAPLLTGTGCPYNCAYCASALLSEGFVRRDPQDVFTEIRELYGMGVRDFAFYDDALLVDAGSHIKVILKEVIRRGLKTRFHCPNGLHARFIDEEIAYLLKKSGFATLRLGLETAHMERQTATGGKVTSWELARAVRMLKEGGFRKGDIGIYLMYGLPGQDFREVSEGVEFLKGLDVKIHLTEFSPIPGTQCWKELLNRGVIDKAIDPLLTNNTVFSFLYSGYDPGEVDRLELDVKEFNRRQ
jgi:radical SAM superfamily enzyme YgiQ (UPF0313 family)